MIEMMLILPFLVFILLLVLYFGRGVARVQHAQVMDRYEACRAAAPAVLDPSGNGQVVPNGPVPNDPAGNPQMNQAFFGGAAASITYSASGYFPSDAGNDLTADGRAISNDTGDLIAQALSDFPQGSTARFGTTHNSNVRLWMLFEHPIDHAHTRLGNDWLFANSWIKRNNEWLPTGGGPWMLAETPKVFFTTLDNDMVAFANQGNPMGSMIRGIYSNRPGYVGPTILLP